MEEARLKALEYRVARLETTQAEESSDEKTKKNHHRVFEYPAIILKETFDKLINVRRELVRETNRGALNLILSGEHLAKMIESKCSSLDDMRTIRGIGNVNIDKFGQRFIDILAPPATPSLSVLVPAPTPTLVSVSVPPNPSTMTK